MSRVTYVLRDGELVEKSKAAPLPTQARSLFAMSDIAEFRSPIDGSIISSRSQLRDHQRKHNVIQAGDDPSLYRKPKAYESDMDDITQDVIRVCDALGIHG